MGLGLFAVAFVGSAVGLWIVSQITEALRPSPGRHLKTLVASLPRPKTPPP